MITVAHIITALGSGGAERVLYLVASRNPEGSGIRHLVVSLSDDGVYGDELRRAGVELECLGMRPGRPPLAAFVKLVRLLRRKRPDVLMTWLYHADLMGTLAGRCAGIRQIIWNIRCSDFDFSQHPPTTRWIVALLARLSRLPSAVAANSHAGRHAHEALGFKPKRWIYLPNGFDTELWRPDAADRDAVRRELGFSPTNVVIGMVARVDPQKDHASFLAAAGSLVGRHPNLRLLLIGSGTQELGIPTHLRPFTVALGQRRDVPRLMRSLDILVSSSAYGEGFPNVLGEAMASGVPCVTTDVGDAAFVAGEAGTIVPPKAPEALAAAIEGLMARPPGELQALAARGRKRIESAFHIEGCLQAYADVIREAAAEGHRERPQP